MVLEILTVELVCVLWSPLDYTQQSRTTSAAKNVEIFRGLEPLIFPPFLQL